jgi:hypothetical protein
MRKEAESLPKRSRMDESGLEHCTGGCDKVPEARQEGERYAGLTAISHVVKWR